MTNKTANLAAELRESRQAISRVILPVLSDVYNLSIDDIQFGMNNKSITARWASSWIRLGETITPIDITYTYTEGVMSVRLSNLAVAFFKEDIVIKMKEGGSFNKLINDMFVKGNAFNSH